MGLLAQSNKSFGEAVARLKKAMELLKDADRKGESYFKPYELTATLKKDFESVEKDNNFIYNDRVPDFGTLEPPGKASVAKTIQFESPASNFLDLFAHLVPLPVSRALTAYNDKKQALVAGEMEKLSSATHNLNELLASKNLPAAIEDMGGDQVPESIRQKSQEIKELGGLQGLEDTINSLPDLLSRNREILDEVITVSL
jgi:programmed cell death 6-interacting protein